MLSIDNELEAAQEDFNNGEENPEQQQEVQQGGETVAAEENVEEESGIPAEAPAEAEENTTSEAPQVTHGKAKRLFVGNISYSSTEEDVKTYFEQFGPVVELQLMKKKKVFGEDKQQHRGFGFMKFANQEITDTVMGQSHEVGGKTLNINLAKEKTVKFFVGGIARDKTTTETLKAHFESYGEIKDAFCLVDRGFGFVTIVDDGDNLKPILATRKHEIDGKMCDVKVAQPKGSVQGGRGGRGRGGRGRGRGRGGRGRGGYGGQQYGGYGGQQWGGYGGQQPYGGQRYAQQYSPYGGGRQQGAYGGGQQF